MRETLKKMAKNTLILKLGNLSCDKILKKLISTFCDYWKGCGSNISMVHAIKRISFLLYDSQWLPITIRFFLNMLSIFKLSKLTFMHY